MMRIPFLHRSVIGVYISRSHVFWAELICIWGQLVRAHYATEPVVNGDLKVALESLVSRIHPSQVYVATHLDSDHVRHFILQGPGFDDEETLHMWAQNQAARQLPSGADIVDFIVRFQVIVQTVESTICLLSMARKEAVERRYKVFYEAGLQPISIGCAETELVNVLAHDEEIVEGRLIALLLRENDASLLVYQDGIIIAIRVLPAGSNSADKLIQLLEIVINDSEGELSFQQSDRLLVVGQKSDLIAHLIKQAQWTNYTVLEGKAIRSGRRQAPLVPSTHLLPAGLAIKHLFWGFQDTVFTERDTVDQWQRVVDKADAYRIMTILGSLVGSLLLFTSLGLFFLNAKKVKSDEDMVRMAGQIAEVEQARSALTKLLDDVEQAEQLVTERTNVATILERIGRLAPEQLWLESIRLLAEGSVGHRLIVKGAAQDERGVADYLDRLERDNFMDNVSLVYSETVSAKVLNSQIRLGDQVLVRFEISMLLATITHETVGEE